MRLSVDEGHVAGAALSAHDAAALRPGEFAGQIASAIAAAMPGSQSARLGAVLASTLNDLDASLRVDLLAYAEALAAGARAYALRESSIASWVQPRVNTSTKPATEASTGPSTVQGGAPPALIRTAA